MSWGYKIFIVYIVFVCGIAYLIIRSTREKIDLVTPDYYSEELKYQDKINESKNTAQLSGKLNIIHRHDSLLLQLPAEFNGVTTKGGIKIYYPADKNKDITVPFETMNAFVGTVLPKNIYGQHELHISWAAGGKNYYFEQKIFF